MKVFFTQDQEWGAVSSVCSKFNMNIELDESSLT